MRPARVGESADGHRAAHPLPASSPGSTKPRVSKSRTAAIAVAVIAGASLLAFAVVKWWPRAIEIRAPADLDHAAPEVRDHVLARIARAREQPKDATRQADLGLALAANGFWPEARAPFEIAAELTPDDPLPAFYAARASLESGDSARARVELTAIVERFPRFAPAHYALGMILVEAGAADDAVRRFEELVEVDRGSAFASVGLASALLSAGKAERAIEVLEPVVRREPSLQPGQYLLGTAYRAVKKPDLARAHLAMGVRSEAGSMPDPWSSRLDAESRSVGARLQIAQRLQDGGRQEEAITLLEALRAAHPDNLEVLSNLGAAYLVVNRPSESRATLLLAAKADPSHVPTLYNLVATEIRLQDPATALQHANRAVELAPTHFQAYVARADALTALHRFSEAYDALGRGLRLNPKSASLHTRAGFLLIKMERLPEAKMELEAATGLDALSIDAWGALCEVCVRLKLAGEARRALDQLRILAPDSPSWKGLVQPVDALGGG